MKNVVNKAVTTLRAIMTLAVTGLLTVPKAFAVGNSITLQTPSAGPLAKITAILQQVIDFLGGAGVTAVLIAGCVTAYALWVFAPKAGGALGLMMRVIIGAVVVMNLALVYTWVTT